MERYAYRNILGSGSFGRAWLVRSRLSNRPYVVKEIDIGRVDGKERDQAINEVSILALLRHVNIIRYREAFVTGTSRGAVLAIVMEHADCGDLAQQIDQARCSKEHFSTSQILDWFIQLTFALQYIHSEKILHRDLKPSNLFLTSTGLLKVGDFGISKVLQNTTDHASTKIGTPYYLSPEVCRGKPYNKKSDMWSSGCVLYELIMLARPFNGLDISTLIINILLGNYTPIPRSYEGVLSELVTSLLSADPMLRPTAHCILASPDMRPYVKSYTERRNDKRTSTAASHSSNAGIEKNNSDDENDCKRGVVDRMSTEETNTAQHQHVVQSYSSSPFRSSTQTERRKWSGKSYGINHKHSSSDPAAMKSGRLCAAPGKVTPAISSMQKRGVVSTKVDSPMVTSITDSVNSPICHSQTSSRFITIKTGISCHRYSASEPVQLTRKTGKRCVTDVSRRYKTSSQVLRYHEKRTSPSQSGRKPTNHVQTCGKGTGSVETRNIDSTPTSQNRKTPPKPLENSNRQQLRNPDVCRVHRRTSPFKHSKSRNARRSLPAMATKSTDSYNINSVSSRLEYTTEKENNVFTATYSASDGTCVPLSAAGIDEAWHEPKQITKVPSNLSKIQQVPRQVLTQHKSIIGEHCDLTPTKRRSSVQGESPKKRRRSLPERVKDSKFLSRLVSGSGYGSATGTKSDKGTSDIKTNEKFKANDETDLKTQGSFGKSKSKLEISSYAFGTTQTLNPKTIPKTKIKNSHKTTSSKTSGSTIRGDRIGKRLGAQVVSSDSPMAPASGTSSGHFRIDSKPQENDDKLAEQRSPCKTKQIYHVPTIHHSLPPSQRPRMGSGAAITCPLPKYPEKTSKPRSRIKHGTFTLNIPTIPHNLEKENSNSSSSGHLLGRTVTCHRCKCRLSSATNSVAIEGIMDSARKLKSEFEGPLKEGFSGHRDTSETRDNIQERSECSSENVLASHSEFIATIDVQSQVGEENSDLHGAGEINKTNEIKYSGVRGEEGNRGHHALQCENETKMVPSDSSRSSGGMEIPTGLPASPCGFFERGNAIRRPVRHTQRRKSRSKSREDIDNGKDISARLSEEGNHRGVLVDPKPDLIPDIDEVFLVDANGGGRPRSKLSEVGDLRHELKGACAIRDDSVNRKEIEVAEVFSTSTTKRGELTTELRGKLEQIQDYLERRIGTERTLVAFDILANAVRFRPRDTVASENTETHLDWKDFEKSENVMKLVSDVIGPGMMKYFPILVQAFNLSSQCNASNFL